VINTDPTFQASHFALQKQPVYFLEIQEVDTVWGSYVRAVLNPLGTGYGLQGYGMVGYGF
jgi:hypothetical protein